MSGPSVVKLGSNLVVGPDRRPRQEIVAAVSAEVSDLVHEGTPVVVVSSGAIALGAARARLRNGRKGLAPMQAASALGQPDPRRQIAAWQRLASTPWSLTIELHGSRVAVVNATVWR